MNEYKRDDKRLWKRMSFKGNKVWVAMNDHESFHEKNNKLLIKYGLTQDYEYLVKKENIKPVSQAVPASERKKKKTTRTKTREKSENSNQISVFTDGASSGNPGPSGIGVYMVFKNKTKEISESIGNATNNIAELKAIKRGLEELKRFDLPVMVYTDSNYCLGVLTKNWKTHVNQSLINEIKNLLAKFNQIEITKVKGHAGIHGNEVADKLATSAIR